MSQRKIIFFHLPKTGGTALREILLAPFLKEEQQLLYQRENFREDVRNFATNSKAIAVGHMGWEPELEHILAGVLKITCLRDPVKNVISHYLHFRHSQDPRHHEYGRLSFPEFLKTPFANNWQCQRLGGRFYDSHMEMGECFDEALKNVRERFAAVGLTEYMDQTLVLFREVLQLNLQRVPVRNITADPAAAEELQQYADAIREQNWLDEKLHGAVRERFGVYKNL